MKFSVIIPVFNVEKYLEKCLNSVLKQTYQNYEVIIVCDKSTDNSEKIVDAFLKKSKKFTKICEDNTGLSKARNIGIKKATGDYLLFLDSDDFWEETLLETLNKNITKDLEIIRFQANKVEDKKITNYPEDAFNVTTGPDAFSKIINFHYIENSWLYAYKKDFFEKNKFTFMDDCIAEDFGLTPLILYKAKKVIGLKYTGYNYVQRDKSLMNNDNYEQKLKKARDMLKQARYLKKEIKDTPENKDFIRFINNSLINYITTLKYKDYKKLNKPIKKEGYYNHLKITGLTTFKNVVLIKINAYLYFNYFVRKK